MLFYRSYFLLAVLIFLPLIHKTSCDDEDDGELPAISDDFNSTESKTDVDEASVNETLKLDMDDSDNVSGDELTDDKPQDDILDEDDVIEVEEKFEVSDSMDESQGNNDENQESETTDSDVIDELEEDSSEDEITDDNANEKSNNDKDVEEKMDTDGGEVISAETTDSTTSEETTADELSIFPIDEINNLLPNDSNSSCAVSKIMMKFTNVLQGLMDEIKSLRHDIAEKCPSFEINLNETEILLNDTETGGTENTLDTDEDDDSSSEEEEEEEKKSLSCRPPFKAVAESCFYFVYHESDWKNWGDAKAYCQILNGTLASPSNMQALRDYLDQHHSKVFWVGAKRLPKNGKFEWLSGNLLSDDDWAHSQPTKGASRFCVYLESFSGYKAVNHYCGEKFSFICEQRDD